MPITDYDSRRISLKWIFLIILIILLVIAFFTVPTEDKMKKDMDSMVKREIQNKTAVKEASDKDAKEMFYSFNKIEYFKHVICRLGWMHNRYKTKESLGCIGIFGVTIPTMNIGNYIYPNGPVRGNLFRGGVKNPEQTKIIGDKDYDTGALPEDDWDD